MKILLFTALLAVICFLDSSSNVVATPLDDYVNKPDSNYNYKLVKAYSQTGYTLYILNMTSQKWQDETIVDRPIWWHFMAVTVPDKITRPDASLMWIGGGSNREEIPKPTDNEVSFISMFAVSTGTISTHLQQIPNQPLVFKKDPKQKSRREDDIIAFTWRTFLENPSDPSILIRLPMTKAVVRAMDTVQDFTSKNGWADIKKFMVAGESKRGWTTWTTAAVDTKRVFSAMPIVMDFLSLNTNLHNHYKSLGGWTFAFDSYYSENITKYVDSRELFELQKVVDPYMYCVFNLKAYLDRLQNTNLMLVTTSGDEFFLNDDTRIYWDQLVAATGGKVLLKRIPNAEHEIYAHEINELFTLCGFFLSTYENKNLPNLKWAFPNNSTHGIIRATIDFTKTPTKPFNVRVYYAQTLDNKRRDFRLVIGDPKKPGSAKLNPVIWLNSEKIINKTETDSTGTYEVAFRRPPNGGGWFAFFLQFSFTGLEYSTNVITTETNIIPETYPFADCSGESCYGTLV